MARDLSIGLFAFALALALPACGGDPSTPGERPRANAEGTMSVALTADNNGVTYRLSKATFVITGPTLANPLIVKPPPDTPIDTETLPTGKYSAVLKDGWVLESKGPAADATFAALQASLITPNPTDFAVTKGGVTEVFFGFSTAVGDVGLGQGTANIRIGVQDCTEFNGIGAALASYTLACLGTIEPKSYIVSADGILSRTFDTCSQDQTALASIDGLLSLQLRSVRLPFAKECIAGRWSTWKAQFENNPIVCPTWSKQKIINEPTDAQLKILQQTLDGLAQDTTGRLRAQVPDLFDEGALYGVTFANAAPPPNQKCQTAGDCGALCAGGFPGFVLQNDAGTVLTDGPYWLTDNQYAPGTDPYLRTGSYYHPMSYYGPSPGTQFAHRNRVSTCPPGVAPTTPGSCGPEVCSYGVTNVHIPLRCDCLNTDNNKTCPSSDSSCVGMCAP